MSIVTIRSSGEPNKQWGTCQGNGRKSRHDSLLRTCSRAPPSSALGRNRPFVLVKIDPHQEHDLPRGKKTASDIIPAEGVSSAVPSSAPQARKLVSLREKIAALVE